MIQKKGEAKAILLHRIHHKPNLCISVKIHDQKIHSTELSLTDDGFHLEVNSSENAQLIEQLLSWLRSYSRKESSQVQLPFFFIKSGFFEQSLQLIKKIPFGKTHTYKEIAEKMDHPNASRAVGGACRSNPFPLFIPCHRILASNGGLGGFAYGLKMKRQLLEFEGVICK